VLPFLEPFDHQLLRAGGETTVKKLTIAACFAVCIIVPRSFAQRNEVAGLIGRTFISDQGIVGSNVFDNELRFGKGLSFEANYARGVLGSSFFTLWLEVPFVVNPDEDLHAALPNRVPQQYSAFILTPSARLNLFPEAGLSPWVSFGGGFAHYGSSSNLLFGGTYTGDKGSTSGVLQAGGGLDVKLFQKFSLRGEVRDFWTGVPALGLNTGKTRQHNYFVAGGLVWRF
jgi:hypothetical protein